MKEVNGQIVRNESKEVSIQKRGQKIGTLLSWWMNAFNVRRNGTLNQLDMFRSTKQSFSPGAVFWFGHLSAPDEPLVQCLDKEVEN